MVDEVRANAPLPGVFEYSISGFGLSSLGREEPNLDGCEFAAFAGVGAEV